MHSAKSISITIRVWCTSYIEADRPALVLFLGLSAVPWTYSPCFRCSLLIERRDTCMVTPDHQSSLVQLSHWKLNSSSLFAILTWFLPHQYRDLECGCRYTPRYGLELCLQGPGTIVMVIMAGRELVSEYRRMCVLEQSRAPRRHSTFTSDLNGCPSYGTARDL